MPQPITASLQLIVNYQLIHPSPVKLLRGALKWTCGDLNPRPLPCKGSDLPADLQAPFFCMSDVFSAFGDILILGGDPAADSPTATLLRLNPPCKIQV